MTDKVIRVNVTSSKSQKVTVSSSKVANEITASPDTSAYYSRLAKNWAIAEGLVENIDYSSKHYAQESKASADMAKTYENATQENYNMFLESSFNANSELQTNRDGALADIEGAKTSAIDSLNSIKDENISTIESKANEALTNIETNRDETLSSIENSRSASVSEITSLSNGYISQINTTGNSYDNLTHRNITNCITEIPQRIKLELADGVLTLKAGSEVIVPNGFEADGTTPKFDYVTIESDLSISSWGTGITNTCVLGFRKDGQTPKFVTLLSNCIFSGSTKPTPNVGDYWLWYDTVSNKIKYTSDNGVTWTSEYCAFSIARTQVTNSVFTSIDQIFNGMGYIGSTVWVDKGVKGLIPNGRNEDGTLRNIEYANNKIVISTFTGGYADTFWLRLSPTGTLPNRSTQIRYNIKSLSNAPTPTVGKWYSVYVEDENMFYYSNNGGAYYKDLAMDLGVYSASADNKITSLKPKQPFRAIDYSDKSEVSGWGMPSDKYINLTLGASGSKYVAPANGWYYVKKTAGATGKYLNVGVDGLGWYISLTSSTSSTELTGLCPICKGQTLFVHYDATGTTSAFRFYFAQGEV
jgi:hypothetical protein